MVAEVVPPDPAEILEMYRFVGPHPLAGGPGSLEDTGDIRQNVLVHHGGAQETGIYLPQYGLDPSG